MTLCHFPSECIRLKTFLLKQKIMIQKFVFSFNVQLHMNLVILTLVFLLHNYDIYSLLIIRLRYLIDIVYDKFEMSIQKITNHGFLIT